MPLSDLTPEALAALSAHEARTLDPDEDGSISIPLTALAALNARIQALEAAESERSLLKRERDAALAALRTTQIKNACVPFVIGGNDGVHPDEHDLISGTSPSQLLANLRAQYGDTTSPFPTPMVLVPVPLWPYAIQPPHRPFHLSKEGTPALDQDGRPIPNLQIGQTKILESRLSLPVGIGNHPSVPVSISGMAILSVNRFDGLNPDKVRERIHRRAARLSATPIQNPSLDGGLDTAEGTFIPSQGDERSARP